MSEHPKQAEYRHLATNETLRELFDEMERRAFDDFMARPWWRRFRTAGQGDICRIEVIRDIRRELDFKAKHTTRVVKKVV